MLTIMSTMKTKARSVVETPTGRNQRPKPLAVSATIHRQCKAMAGKVNRGLSSLPVASGQIRNLHLRQWGRDSWATAVVWAGCPTAGRPCGKFVRQVWERRDGGLEARVTWQHPWLEPAAPSAREQLKSAKVPRDGSGSVVLWVQEALLQFLDLGQRFLSRLAFQFQD